MAGFHLAFTWEKPARIGGLARSGGVYMDRGGPALLVGPVPLCRDSASQLNSLSKFVFVYMRGGPALLGGLEIFHIDALKRAGLLGGLASQSSVHTTKVVLTSIF